MKSKVKKNSFSTGNQIIFYNFAHASYNNNTLYIITNSKNCYENEKIYVFGMYVSDDGNNIFYGR